MKPKTAKDVEIVRLQARAMMRTLMRRAKCPNTHQFGAWINNKSEQLGWGDTQDSNKWRKLIDGELTYPPVKSVQMLSQLFHDAERLYNDGPANLWRALWGNAADPTVLWPLCRTRLDSEGPWLHEIVWEEIEASSLNERTFREAIREFEGELLLAKAYGEFLNLNHLAEAIALYRLHQATNSLARSDIDGVGAYRCIRHCLDDPCIFLELDSFDGFRFIHNELVEMEIRRLTTERSYCSSIGIDSDQAECYADDPLSYIDDGTRWDCLDLNWAPATTKNIQTETAGVFDGSRRTKPAPVLPLQTENSSSGAWSHNVVHILSWVRER
ncbi:hypothetical protein ABLT15_01285 [Paraburkholderia tropica]|uniref:hypothetical protein n=1 Tax=Paraburkholderia tropica TaxID=92647 RepID=UPI0032B3F4DD